MAGQAVNLRGAVRVAAQVRRGKGDEVGGPQAADQLRLWVVQLACETIKTQQMQRSLRFCMLDTNAWTPSAGSMRQGPGAILHAGQQGSAPMA